MAEEQIKKAEEKLETLRTMIKRLQEMGTILP